MYFFICGSALRGQPDHGNLGGATFVREAKTKPIYRLHSVRDQHPGIYEVAEGGVAIAGERRAARRTARLRTARSL